MQLEQLTFLLRQHAVSLEDKLEDIQELVEVQKPTLTEYQLRRLFRAFDRMQRAIHIIHVIGREHRAAHWGQYSSFSSRFDE